jgi:hypothetical protein
MCGKRGEGSEVALGGPFQPIHRIIRSSGHRVVEGQKAAGRQMKLSSNEIHGIMERAVERFPACNG